jgi:hypothetical protein
MMDVDRGSRRSEEKMKKNLIESSFERDVTSLQSFKMQKV